MSVLLPSLSRFRFATILVSTLLLVGCAAGPTPAARAEHELEAQALQGVPLGAVNNDVTQENIHQRICVSGWTATVRPSTAYTNALKAKLLTEHGLPTSDAPKYELDHFIPLALGGHPRSPDNLWLQPWGGRWGAKTKDRLEVKLKNLVCQGALTLQIARDAIRRNWIDAFKNYVGANEPAPELTEPID